MIDSKLFILNHFLKSLGRWLDRLT